MGYQIIPSTRDEGLFYRNPTGKEFISPAMQGTLRQIDNPLWKVSMASRAKLPMWDRPDMFRHLSYQNTVGVKFMSPKVEYPSMVISPSGQLTLRNTVRTPSITIPDAELYHYDVQKVFSIMMQFDTMLEHQISGFTGIGIDRVREVLYTLYAADIVERPNPEWEHQEALGTPWRLNPFSERSKAYVDGMSPLDRIITSGNFDLDKGAPPGSGSSSGIRHNIFSAEVALRLSEAGDLVTGVWGDMFASESLFHSRRDDAKARNSHGDMVIVTKDGSIIIVEIVGGLTQASHNFQLIINKAASWVGVIANSMLDISVLFIDVSWHEDRRNMFNAVDIGVRKESAAYAPDNVLRKKAQKKVGIVNSAWWFPEDGTISRAGTRLGAYSPVDHKFRAFDTPDDFYSSHEERRNVVMNTVTAMHTPPWITDPIKERSYK